MVGHFTETWFRKTCFAVNLALKDRPFPSSKVTTQASFTTHNSRKGVWPGWPQPNPAWVEKENPEISKNLTADSSCWKMGFLSDELNVVLGALQVPICLLLLVASGGGFFTFFFFWPKKVNTYRGGFGFFFGEGFMKLRSSLPCPGRG